jgi:hypothetical protein
MCENCGIVYLVAHPHSHKRISRGPQFETSGTYRLACPCGTTLAFHRNDMKAYAVESHCAERGFAEKGDYREQPPIAYRNKR